CPTAEFAREGSANRDLELIRALQSTSPSLPPRDPALAPVAKFLKPSSSDWYLLYVDLDPAKIDPIYVSLAQELGGSVLLGGGSDLIEVAMLQSPKLASTEINVLWDKSEYDRKKFPQSWYLDLQAFRPEATPLAVEGAVDTKQGRVITLSAPPFGLRRTHPE